MAQVWECGHTLRQISIRQHVAATPRRTRLLARGTRRTSGTASQLRRRGGAWRAECGPRKHREAGQGTFGASERSVCRLSLSAFHGRSRVTGYEPETVCPSLSSAYDPDRDDTAARPGNVLTIAFSTSSSEGSMMNSLPSAQFWIYLSRLVTHRG